jgi:hypothetical protein
LHHFATEVRFNFIPLAEQFRRRFAEPQRLVQRWSFELTNTKEFFVLSAFVSLRRDLAVCSFLNF